MAKTITQLKSISLNETTIKQSWSNTEFTFFYQQETIHDLMVSLTSSISKKQSML